MIDGATHEDTYCCSQWDAVATVRLSGQAGCQVPHILPIGGRLCGLGGTMFAISPNGELLSGTRSRQLCRYDLIDGFVDGSDIGGTQARLFRLR